MTMPVAALIRMTAALLLALVTACQQDPSVPDEEVIVPRSYQELEARFISENYHLEHLDQGVPRLVLARLPEDLHAVPSIADKKRLFVQSLLPMVLIANERIAADRVQLEKLFAQLDESGRLDPEEMAGLKEMEEKYRVKGETHIDPKARDTLLRRVDTLPVSLVLAQAANESGWGTSRFAREGNNLFGERNPRAGNGLVPRERPAGARYEVRRFETVYDSLESYMHNLNTHYAYRDLRDARSRLRLTGQPIYGTDLVAGIERYSIRGADYVREIDTMIRHNRLTLLADATLR